jgi:hypothetical protein
VLRRRADPYFESLKDEFGSIVDGLELTNIQERFLRLRWLDQVLWFERKAAYNQHRYYALRLITIVGGVIVPAIVSLNVRKDNVATTLAWVTFSLSLVVAIAAALEGFFHYGERWRSFRRTSEALKAHGWQFFELAGPYEDVSTHVAAFPRFAAQVEALLQQDVETFITEVAREHTLRQAGGGKQEGPAR